MPGRTSSWRKPKPITGTGFIKGQKRDKSNSIDEREQSASCKMLQYFKKGIKNSEIMAEVTGEHITK